MNQVAKFLIDQWLKGVGAFLLIFIDADYLLTTRFRILEGKEKYEATIYLLLLILIVFLPVFLGKTLDFISLILSKIINNWQSTNNSWNLKVLMSLSLSLTLNTIAIQRLFFQGTNTSLLVYMEPEISKKNIDELVNYALNLNFLFLILLALISTVIFFYLCHLFSISKFFRKFYIEDGIVIGVLVSVITIVWSLVYANNSSHHLNAVLFPLAAINSNSPFIPLVSDEFTTWYGGYYLWLNLLSRLIGNSLLSIKSTLCGLIAIQIILYYLITKGVFKNRLIGILVFIGGIFWSYFYGKIINQDLYFQYFPLRTLFPSIFIVTLFYTSGIKFFDKVVFSIRFIPISFRDFLLDFIIAIAILSNLDSGISVLIMYFFINDWTCRKPEVFWSKHLLNQLIKFIINFILIIIILVLSFRILAGSFIDFSLLTAFTLKVGSGFLGRPFPDNLWMIFMVFYGFNVVHSLVSPIEDTIAKYRFGIAVWGLLSIFYFVNRSLPLNLMYVSLPFFLSYGFFIEYVFYTSFHTKEIFEAESRMGFTKFFKIFLSNKLDLLKLSLVSVLIMPFIIISLITFLKFIPLTIYELIIPKSYSQILAVESLSQKVAKLEIQLKRPSIFISDSFESIYYLHKNRKILFYPDIDSIKYNSFNFESRFINALKKFDPIVTICPLKYNKNLYRTYMKLLHENNYKFLQSIKQKQRICDVYIRF